MRWDQLRFDATSQAPLPLSGAVTRTFDTPGFAGITFYEIQARSALNRVPEASRVPFQWTVNPYRGCTHAWPDCHRPVAHQRAVCRSCRGLDPIPGHTPPAAPIEPTPPPASDPPATTTPAHLTRRADGHWRLPVWFPVASEDEVVRALVALGWPDPDEHPDACTIPLSALCGVPMREARRLLRPRPARHHRRRAVTGRDGRGVGGGGRTGRGTRQDPAHSTVADFYSRPFSVPGHLVAKKSRCRDIVIHQA